MYAVVEFVGSDDEETSNDVAVVPLSWLHKNQKKCYWPVSTANKKFIALIKECAPPRTHWPSYKVFKIHGKTDSFEEADRIIEDLLKDNQIEVAESEASGTSIISLTRKTRLRSEEVLESNSPSFLSTASTVTIESGSSSDTSFQQVMLSNLSKLTAHVEQHTLLLHDIIKNQKKSSLESLSMAAPPETPNFPITSLEFFKEFDLLLTQDSDLSAYLICRLAAVGGQDVQSSTRAIMRFLMSDDVAKHFNWKGREKLPFESTNIKNVIHDAVKRNFNTSDHLISRAIKDWLKFANARIKAKRQEKQ